MKQVKIGAMVSERDMSCTVRKWKFCMCIILCTVFYLFPSLYPLLFSQIFYSTPYQTAGSRCILCLHRCSSFYDGWCWNIPVILRQIHWSFQSWISTMRTTFRNQVVGPTEECCLKCFRAILNYKKLNMMFPSKQKHNPCS